MSTDQPLDAGRAWLGFADLVRQHFAFLATLGFSELEARPTIVRYRTGDLELNVFHGRESYEIGLQVGHQDAQYAMSELIRATDQGAADTYRNPVATSPAAVASGVERVAELLRTYGGRALHDDREFFSMLRAQRDAWAQAYAQQVIAEQTRPKAEAAFREGRFREAVELYESMAPSLTPTEQAKLAAARRRT